MCFPKQFSDPPLVKNTLKLCQCVILQDEVEAQFQFKSKFSTQEEMIVKTKKLKLVHSKLYVDTRRRERK